MKRMVPLLRGTLYALLAIPFPCDDLVESVCAPFQAKVARMCAADSDLAVQYKAIVCGLNEACCV